MRAAWVTHCTQRDLNGLFCTAQILAGAGVDLDLVADVDEQGDFDFSASFQRGGLESVGGGVASQARLSLGHFQIHEVGYFHAEHVAFVAEQLAGGVLGDELEGFSQCVLVQGKDVYKRQMWP